MARDDLPRRRNSQRYPGHDYSQPGAVFITLCSHHRQCLFGQVVEGKVVLSAAGAALTALWRDVPDRFPSVVLDEFVLMPDHLHAILFLGTNPWIDSKQAPALADVVRWYKVVTQRAYSEGVRSRRWPRYERHLWQRDYHDHIIRNGHELDRIRTYIEGNPGRWQERQDAMKAGKGS